MIRIAAAYLLTGLAFAMIDAVWLTTMAPRLYRPEIGAVLAPNFRLGPAVVFYLLYIAGILWFAVLPALEGGGWKTAALQGAILGLLCYATYDLTNQATLSVWSLKVTILDLIWGTVLTAGAASVGTLLTARLLPGGGS